MGKFDFILERMKNRTPGERMEALVRSGIIDLDGKLADQYCTKQQLQNKIDWRKERNLPRIHVGGRNHAGLV